MHIIGTAGHVDHGKSALVRALTGTDPDRWIEEQRRGMTLDLGFAHLTFDDGSEAGVVDVPGHERFLHNMLAGAAGMELVLLVVAANEGVKPQTLEHLAILDFLAARRTIIVLSKSDTVEPAELPAIAQRFRGDLEGTIAHAAPVLAVSTVTGAGLSELRAAIHAELANLPLRAPHAPPYLPVDRVFARAGHGTVVTGTLMQGHIATGDVLRVTPLDRAVRVRGMQVFGAQRTRVSGGMRVALNLSGIDTSELARGAVLADPQFEPASSFEVDFRPLPAALELLRRRTPVRAYIGAAEILGTLVFERPAQTSAVVAAHLHLRTPAIGIPAAPFVLRRVSPMTLLGGGTITARVSTAVAGAPGVDDPEREAVLATLTAAGLSGMRATEIGAAANLAVTRVDVQLAALLAAGRVRALLKPPAFIAAAVADELLARTLEVLRTRQRERPWLMGVTSIGLAGALESAETALIRVLALFVETGALTYGSGYYATTDFTPELTSAQSAFFDRAFATSAGQPPLPIPFDGLRADMRASPAADLPQALEMLITCGRLTKVGDFVYSAAHLAAIRDALEAELRRRGRITVADFRTLTGTSRKYAVPLLEFFDATGVTLRNGDWRTLRAHSPRNRSPG